MSERHVDSLSVLYVWCTSLICSLEFLSLLCKFDLRQLTWEEARIKSDNTERLLIYSHFNGIYEEEGHYNNRPRYVERNKEKGVPFKRTVPAEIGEISRGFVTSLI